MRLRLIHYASKRFGIIAFGALTAVISVVVFSTGLAATSHCAIKGNIKGKAGKRIYYLPDQGQYDQVNVHFWSGERWFCTPAEARAAGWLPVESPD